MPVNSAVVFFHGLNTYNDDRIHIGPWLKFASQEQALRECLMANQVEFMSAGLLGAGSVESQADNAARNLLRQASPEQLGTSYQLILVGHSAGAIAARAFVHRLPANWPKNWRVSFVISFGSPHRGLELAELGTRLREQRHWFERLLRLLGYRLEDRADAIKQYRKAEMAQLAKRYPNLSEIRYGHLLCQAKAVQLGWPLIFISLLFPALIPRPSDGFVSSQSQVWGESLGQYQLDHYSQMGFFAQLFWWQRQAARREFERLVGRITDLSRKTG